MVVADTGPIHYLVLIEAVGVLELLYGRVLIPQTVAAELEVTGTPDVAGRGLPYRRNGWRSGPTL